jgi:hypothetical protein
MIETIAMGLTSVINVGIYIILTIQAFLPDNWFDDSARINFI